MNAATGTQRVLELTDASFDREVAEGVVLVDFWAPWCGPCRMQAPILAEVAASVSGRARVVKVNVDDNGATAARFGIRSIPTLVLLVAGKVVRTWVGVQQRAGLVQAIDAHAGVSTGE